MSYAFDKAFKVWEDITAKTVPVKLSGIMVNVLKFQALFSFCSQIKCWFQGLNITKCKHGRLWSDCFFRSSLTWVWTVCLGPFWESTSLQNFRTFTIVFQHNMVTGNRNMLWPYRRLYCMRRQCCQTLTQWLRYLFHGWKFSGLFLNSGFWGWLSIESQPQNAEFSRW